MSIRSFLIAVCTLLSITTAFGQQSNGLPAGTAQAIEQQVSASMSKYHLPAASVAVVLDDKLVWSEGFGTADLENHVPATSTTVFRLASVSKTITAVAVMQLVKAGKLQLDMPISACVPQYDPPQEPTLRQLLTHTSGVRHYRNDDDENDPEFVNTHHYASVTASIDQFKDDALMFAPGSQFLYSTHGFTLLGSCVEQTAKIPFVQYVEENIFAPAGMDASRDDQVRALVPNRARPYSTTATDAIENAPLLDTSNRLPGGGFVSTAPDMAKFAIALFEAKVLDSESVKTMFTPILIHTPDGKTYPIALGWAVGGTIGREDAVWMGGNQPGATAMLFLLPRSRTAIVILANKGGEGNAVVELARGIATTLAR